MFKETSKEAKVINGTNQKIFPLNQDNPTTSNIEWMGHKKILRSWTSQDALTQLQAHNATLEKVFGMQIEPYQDGQ